MVVELTPIEYWKKGLLHRGDGLPAILTDSFTTLEYWVNGKFIK